MLRSICPSSLEERGHVRAELVVVQLGDRHEALEGAHPRLEPLNLLAAVDIGSRSAVSQTVCMM